MARKKVLVIGGGTGTFTILRGLREYDLDLSVIVSMTDSGGSNRVIRDEFGLLPTSDLIQCIVALAGSDSNGVLRDLFAYRYSQGTGISGMRFGNLFMAALTDIYGSQEKAIESTCKILGVAGNVIPVTYDKTNLVARYENGTQVLGEHYIDEPAENLGRQRIVELSVFPEAKANNDVFKAVSSADLIVFGPGDLYTSIICNLVIDGVSAAISESKAKKLYVMNLMTKFGQTNNFTAKDHLAELEKYLGKNVVDCVLINKTDSFSKDLLGRYKEEHASPVVDDLKARKGLKIVRENFVSKEIYQRAKADGLKRSLIRHDSTALARTVSDLV